MNFHLAPPLPTKFDPTTGEPAKRTFGPWMIGAFRLLAELKGLRGGPLDPFGRTAARPSADLGVGWSQTMLV